MQTVSYTVAFFIIWWVALFLMLPIGVKSQLEGDDVERGSEPGAPLAPNLKMKLLWTTGLAFAVWAVFVSADQAGLFTAENFSFLSPPSARGPAD